MRRGFESTTTVPPSSDGEAPTRIVSLDAIGRGTILAGKYEVERVLGQGGMGVVVAARSLAGDGRVALKFLLNDASKDPESVERFLREARAASQIPNEHVTRVIETGFLESGAPFIVMELLQGRDLAQILDESKRIPMTLAIDYVLQALEAIGAAHLRGIVHRDIKPANLFLTEDASGRPLVKVLDFGLSKDLGGSRAEAALTQTSTGAMGTPLYMAPEQVKSAKSATFVSDIWSMGVVIHELVSGDVPFDGANLGALLGVILSEPAKPLRVSFPSAPAGLEAVVLRCLEKDPRKRPRDVLELATSLRPFASPAGVQSVERIRAAFQQVSGGWSPSKSGDARATQQSVSNEASGSDAPRARGRWAFSSDPARQRRRGAAAVSFVVLLGVALGAVLLWRVRVGHSTQATPSTPTAADPLPAASPAVATTPEPSTTGVVEPSVEPSSAVPSASAAAEPPTAPSASKTSRPSSPGSSSRAPPPPPPAPAPPPTAGSPSLEDLLKRGRR